jgi:hypothetical protein
MLTIILNTRIKVRILVPSNQFIPLTEFPCYVSAVVYPTRFSPDPNGAYSPEAQEARLVVKEEPKLYGAQLCHGYPNHGHCD